MHGEAGPFSPPAGGFGATIGEALAWLDRHINLEAIESGVAGRHALPTLERIAALVAAMDDPQRSYPVVHITGTNGKGSTARMSAALLLSEGFNPGVYTSPHLEDINERLSVGGHVISDSDLAQQIAALAELEVFLGVKATWFELVTAAAFRWFADEAVDSAVVEVGLGGRFDATNVADGSVAVVTNVELDHVDILGGTREMIAAEKAGIVKAGAYLVLGERDPDLAQVFEDEAAKVGAEAVWRRGEDFGVDGNRLAVGGRVVDLYTPLGRYEDVFIPLHGAHQADNAAAALAAVQALLGIRLSGPVVKDAFASVTVPGRLEVIGRRPLIVLDGAHNAAGAAAAGAALVEDFSGRPVVLVMGCLRGRDAAELLSGLGPERIRSVLACTPPSPRAQHAEAVVAAAEALGLVAEDCGGVAEAVERARQVADEDQLVLVTGSLYVVGAARTLLRG
ncbi:MAG: Mur ligase family protein [Acidimicrobiales bacterium]